MTQLYLRLGAYMQIKFIDDKKNKTTSIKSKLTSWNAYKKLTESSYWEGIVRQIYKRSKNKDYYINRLLDSEDSTWRHKFYTNNVKRRGKDSLINHIFTKTSEYTRRKKRK